MTLNPTKREMRLKQDRRPKCRFRLSPLHRRRVENIPARGGCLSHTDIARDGHRYMPNKTCSDRASTLHAVFPSGSSEAGDDDSRPLLAANVPVRFLTFWRQASSHTSTNCLPARRSRAPDPIQPLSRNVFLYGISSFCSLLS
jgi:hypothetical protein